MRAQPCERSSNTSVINIGSREYCRDGRKPADISVDAAGFVSAASKTSSRPDVADKASLRVLDLV